MDEQKLIQDPSQKVLAMYQAVIEFINEGCDINTFCLLYTSPSPRDTR